MCCCSDRSFPGRIIVPRFVHLGCRLGAFAEMRRRLIPTARGLVVEVGFGSGHNLPHYDPAKVERVIGIDPDRAMLDLAPRRAVPDRIRLELIEAGAEAMPLDDAIADTVVVTYAFCTIRRVDAALAEIRRVLKPGGRLLFIEHARAETSSRRRWQERLDRPWGRLAGGCHLNRDPEAALRKAGFVTRDVQRRNFTGMLWLLGDHVAGIALPAA